MLGSFFKPFGTMLFVPSLKSELKIFRSFPLELAAGFFRSLASFELE